MSRVHLHVVVDDLVVSRRYYTALFGAEPTVVKDDYLKWELDEPRINLDITTRGRIPGLDHVGIQYETSEELDAVQARLSGAEFDGQVLKDTGCCYEHSDKYWTLDPQGLAWETFHSLYPIDTFSGRDDDTDNQGCCAPLFTSSGDCKT